MNPRAILPALFVFAVAACSDSTGPDRDDDSRPLQEEHASFDFPAEIGGREYILTYEGTHDIVEEVDPEVRHVVIVHHGAGQNPVSYFNRALGSYSQRPDRVRIERESMVISVAAIGEDHVLDDPDRYDAGHYPYWGSGWRGGEESLNVPAVSNFDLMDAMALHIADEFPGVESMVFQGHSAGGQVMSRYAVGSEAHDALEERGVRVRYVISNPSSFLYLDRRRPDLDADEGVVDYADEEPVVDDEPCPGFNDYHYGFEEDVPAYMTRRDTEEMISDFRDREVFVFQGAEDNDPEASLLDRGCSAMTQGEHRLERGERYFDYLGEVYGSEVYETTSLVVVPDVGHSSTQMFASREGQEILFLDFLD